MAVILLAGHVHQLASSLLVRGADRLTRELMEFDHLNPASLPPGTRIGPWRLLEQRGRGTYGVVYRAVPAEPRAAHAVALKRDVKGDNVRVRRADAQLFLLDFGSGHYLGAATLTQQPFPPGTPAYRSPEARRFVLRAGKPPLVPYPPGPADDLFALGVTAFRLIMEKYPPAAHPGDEAAWLWRPEELEHWTARVCNPRCLAELSALVSRMLSPCPEARGSAREMAEALEQAARSAGREAEVPLFTGEAPRPAGLFAFPPRVTVRPPPRMRRWPWVVAAGLGGALALSAGGC